MEKEKMMQLCRRVHWLTLIIGVLTMVLPLIFWGKIPEQIPMHYNAEGVVDNWSDKSSLILLFLVIAMLLGVMSIVIYFVKSSLNSQYSSEQEKSEMSVVYPMVVSMNLVVQCMFAYIMFCAVTSRNLGTLFLPVTLIATFAPVAYFIIKKPKKPEKEIYKSIEKQEQGVVYRSKVDWWLGILLGGSAIWMIYLAIEPIVRTGKVEWIIMISTIITVGLILPLFAIKYVMYSDHMLVSCGIYGKIRVRYADIVGVKATHNPISSAAMSINRLQIDYVEDGIHGMVLISPVRRKTFLEELEKHRNKV